MFYQSFIDCTVTRSKLSILSVLNLPKLFPVPAKFLLILPSSVQRGRTCDRISDVKVDITEGILEELTLAVEWFFVTLDYWYGKNLNKVLACLSNLIQDKKCPKWFATRSRIRMILLYKWSIFGKLLYFNFTCPDLGNGVLLKDPLPGFRLSWHFPRIWKSQCNIMMTWCWSDAGTGRWL